MSDRSHARPNTTAGSATAGATDPAAATAATETGEDAAPLALVLGASGYVGGRLVPRLLDAGYRVRVLARTPGKLRDVPWARSVDVRAGDLLEGGEEVEEAFAGCDVVYHLVHSMGSTEEFAAADRRIARRVSSAAHARGLRRVVYLGGLGEVDEHSSQHLASRAEVADILAAGPTPCTVLRAGVIIGSGSASFEMLRHLVEKLPVMVTPRWVHTRTQPIAIRDVLRYLVVAADAAHEDGADHDYDIGGPDVLTYLDMMRIYARVAGLPRRLVVPVPVLTPSLSSHWVNLVTPVPFGVARPLIDSLTMEVIVRDAQAGETEDIATLDPHPTIPYDQALRLALLRVRDAEVETSWRDAEIGGRSPAEPYPGDPEWTGGTLLTDVHESDTSAPAPYAFATVSRVGGGRGWPTHMWAWSIRGRMDRLIGGVGLRRGRRDPNRLRVGDALDFWRVEEIRQPGAGGGTPVGSAPAPDPQQVGLLRLRAEMRVPGAAWLEWRIQPHAEDTGARLTQRALFAPRGLLGRVYWWSMLPFHAFIFASMLRSLARQAEELASSDTDGSVLAQSLEPPQPPRPLAPPQAATAAEGATERSSRAAG